MLSEVPSFMVPESEGLGPHMLLVHLEFPMELPSKKNNLQRRGGKARGGRLMYSEEVRSAMRTAELLSKVQWGARLPVEHPMVFVKMAIANPAKDPDGIWTTLVDALVKGGVLRDDSVREFNGPKYFAPVALCEPGHELVVVELVFPDPDPVTGELHECELPRVDPFTLRRMKVTGREPAGRRRSPK